MTFGLATRATMTAGLLLAAGYAVPAQGQGETQTVRERVVVTLPSGKRIVRMVEKQVPVAVVNAPTVSPVDPFVPPSGDANDDNSSDGSGFRSEGGEIDPRILEWIGWYQSGDSRADANDDGRVTAADFNAFLMLINGQNNDDTKNDGGGNTNDDNTNDDNTNDDNTNDDNGNTGGNTGGPETGWTELAPSSDSLVFYVAESGSDSNDGLSPNRPLRTIAEGVRKLRDGQPDWLLLRRGDTFSENMGGNWDKSGRSESEKMVIGAYGEGPRPVLLTGTGKGITLFKSDRREHLAFVSLEIRAGVRYSDYGISFVSSGVRDVLFEDLLVSGFTHAIAIQGDGNGDARDIKIRRSVFLDSGGSTHSQGIFTHKVDGLTIEQCIIDQHGWRPDRGRDASATIFAHNVYVQRSVKNLVFRDNFSSRSSSHGVQARSGGVVDRNVFWQNPIAVMYGNEGLRDDELPVQGTVNDNLVLEGIHQNSEHRRGWGIQIQHADGVTMARNIIANSEVTDGFGYGIMLFTSRPADNKNLLVVENIVDDYGRNLRIDEDDVISTTLRNNLFSKTIGDLPLVTHSEGIDLPGLVYDGNRYLHTTRTNEFQVANSQIDLPEWQADFDPRGGPLLPGSGSNDPYVNGSATLDDYARSIGFSGVDAFIDAMRKQRKGNWDERLTSESIRAYFRGAFEIRSGS